MPAVPHWYLNIFLQAKALLQGASPRKMHLFNFPLPHLHGKKVSAASFIREVAARFRGTDDSTVATCLRVAMEHHQARNDPIEAEVSITQVQRNEKPCLLRSISCKAFTSDYGTDSLRSDLTSLKSSIVNYEYENGRCYHAFQAGKYI